MPSAARRGWISSRKQRCCSSTSSWIRTAMAAFVSAGVSPSGAGVLSPTSIRRFKVTTRTMKHSSRFELKMARNLTRSRSGTLGSCASSSTRRLNSSHDSSRLMNASVFMSASTVECFAQKDAVAHAARADDHFQVAAEDHGLLDDDGPGQDDIGSFRLEAADLPALPPGEALQALADRGDVGLAELKPVAILPLALVRPQVDAGERADGAAQPHHDLAALRRREAALELGADFAAEHLERARLGPVVAHEAARGPHRAPREAWRGEKLSGPHA